MPPPPPPPPPRYSYVNSPSKYHGVGEDKEEEEEEGEQKSLEQSQGDCWQPSLLCHGDRTVLVVGRFSRVIRLDALSLERDFVPPIPLVIHAFKVQTLQEKSIIGVSDLRVPFALRTFSSETMLPEVMFAGHKAPSYFAFVSASGTKTRTCKEDPFRVVSADNGNDPQLLLWDGQTGETTVKMPISTPPISLVHFPEWDRELFLGAGGQRTFNEDHSIFQYDLTRGVVSRRLEGHTSIIPGICASYSSNALYSASYDPSLKCWSHTTGDCVGSVRLSNWGTSICSVEDRNLVIVGMMGGRHASYDTRALSHPLAEFWIHEDAAWGILRIDMDCYVSADMDNDEPTVKSWRHDGKIFRQHQVPGPVLGIALNSEFDVDSWNLLEEDLDDRLVFLAVPPVVYHCLVILCSSADQGVRMLLPSWVLWMGKK